MLRADGYYVPLSPTGAELLFEVCAGYDSEDAFSREREAVTGLGDARVRVGVPQAKDLEFFGDHENADLFLAAVERVKSWGADVTRFDLSPFREAAVLTREGDGWALAPLAASAAAAPNAADDHDSASERASASSWVTASAVAC